ncbi:MAG: zinc-binding dehydrogenase [Acidobacteriota bacterium]|nr:zinc-binding dehydrogenase [Acidobacteriota bacterium]
MKAVRIHEFGGPEVLKYEDIPEPELRKNHVLVRARACALNHLDLWVRKGLPGVKLPHILGSDVAGEVVECGEYVTDLNEGTRVLLAPMVFCGHCEQCNQGRQNFCARFAVLGNGVDGGNCELIAVPRVNVIPIPDTLEFVQAASVPLVFLTAWHMLLGRAGLKAGQTVLVLGAGSGVGSAAIQICKMLSAEVITTAGDEHKLAKARELGADHTIDHYKQKIGDQVRRITGKRGVDIVFEHVGQATWKESLKSLKHGGTLVTCGATTGFEGNLDLRFLFSRQLTLLGSYMGAMGELDEVLKHVFAGKLKPVVDRTFPLSETRAAHEYLESSEQFGKVVLTM